MEKKKMIKHPWGKWYWWIPVLGLLDANPFGFIPQVEKLYNIYQIVCGAITVAIVWKM